MSAAGAAGVDGGGVCVCASAVCHEIAVSTRFLTSSNRRETGRAYRGEVQACPHGAFGGVRARVRIGICDFVRFFAEKGTYRDEIWVVFRETCCAWLAYDGAVE